MYSFDGIIYGAVFGAAGALIVNVVAGKLLKKEVSNKWYLYVAIAAGILGSQHAKSYKSKNPDVIIEKVMSENAIYTTIADYEPGLSEALKASFRQAYYDGHSEEQIMTNGRALISDYIARKARYVNDVLAVDYLKLTIQEINSFKINRPEICRQSMSGRIEGDIRPYMSRELWEKDLAITESLVKAPKLENLAVAADEEAEAILEVVGELAKQRMPNMTPDEIGLIASGQGDPVRTCEFLSIMFGRILAEPPAKAASIFRWMLDQYDRDNTARP